MDKFCQQALARPLHYKISSLLPAIGGHKEVIKLLCYLIRVGQDEMNRKSWFLSQGGSSTTLSRFLHGYCLLSPAIVYSEKLYDSRCALDIDSLGLRLC